VAVDMYATAMVHDTDSEEIDIILEDFDGISASFDKKALSSIYSSYKNKKSIRDYIDQSNINEHILPYATIASRLANEFGLKVTGKVVRITSKVPLQVGCASSASCSTAFTVALLRSVGKRLEDSVVIDVARDGERVVHKSEGAGRIDVIPSYFGGYTSTKDGGRREPIDVQLNMVLINTGPKKSTAETVGNVRKLYEKDREGTEKKLEEIEECAIKGLKALAKGDLVEGGKYMYRDQELLKELGVSSKGLDKVVELAKKNGAYGAKLSGGGGGGMAVAICKDPEALIKVMEENGFKSYVAKVALKGAKEYMPA
jgi:mevalonate kinase